MAKKKAVVFSSPYPYDPLHNTPVTQQKDYSQSWVEFAAQNFQQVIISDGQSTSVNSDFYVVPSNLIFFITGAYMSVESTGAGICSANLQILRGSINEVFLAVQSSGNPDSNSQSANFSMPLRVNGGQGIRHSTSIVAGQSQVQVVGFLVPFVV